MKEYRAESGGRYTFAEDFLNLQDIALSYSGMFGNGNFVVSGCEIVGTQIAPGIVVIDGKLRKFNGAYISATTMVAYIKPTHSTTNTPYESGGSKLGIEEYGCEASLTRPTSGSVITISRGGGGGYLKEEYFGKYMLLLDSDKASQTVSGTVNFSGPTNFSEVKIGEGREAMEITQDEVGTITLKKKECEIVFEDDNIKLFIEGVELMRAERESLSISGLGIAEFNRMKNNTTYTTNIEPNTFNSNSIEINIGDKDQSPATTLIGDGRGNTMLEVNGEDKLVNIFADGLAIDKAYYDSSGATYRAIKNDSGEYRATSFIYQVGDQHDQQGAAAGFMFNVTTRDTGFRTGTYVEYSVFAPSIQFTGDTINFDATLYERGMLLENKYAQRQSGLAQFLVDGVTMSDLREQIGAASNEVEGVTGNIDNIQEYLENEVANTSVGFENIARRIRPEELRRQIGAAAQEDIADTIKDTGWVPLSSSLNGSLYIRYINKVVYVKVNCNASSIDSSGVTMTYTSLSIPTTPVSLSHFVVDSLGGVYKVTMVSNSRTIRIANTLQPNGSDSPELSFIIPFAI